MVRNSNPSFDASHSLLGYLYQVMAGLHVLLNNEEATIKIESLDDLTLLNDDEPSRLLQVKFHSKPASLTDSSKELWKTLRVWCVRVSRREVNIATTHLHLVTTSIAPPGSAAAYLRQDKERNIPEARRLLRKAAASSENQELRTNFQAFLELPKHDQLNLLDQITVADKSPDILELQGEVSRRLSIATSRSNRDALTERVKGWWLSQAVKNLKGTIDEIAGRELYDHIAGIAEQLKPDALPIDFFDAAPSQGQQKDFLERLFVSQLQAINVSTQRIEKSVADYYRAFEQRSRWVREELLLDGELDKYETRLIDEWDRFRLSLEDEEDFASSTEDRMKQLDRSLLNWMEQIADIRIRRAVTEPYVMRGSYHLLADKNPPSVWWHPRFLERLKGVLSESQDRE